MRRLAPYAASLALVVLAGIASGQPALGAAGGIVVEGAVARRQFDLSRSRALTLSAGAVSPRIIVRASKDLAQTALQIPPAGQVMTETLAVQRVVVSGAESTAGFSLSRLTGQASAARIVLTEADASRQHSLVQYPGVSGKAMTSLETPAAITPVAQSPDQASTRSLIATALLRGRFPAELIGAAATIVAAIIGAFAVLKSGRSSRRE